ncbi:hypothetical protein PVAP13_5KG426807 [Panicum virgatum]|uniref:Uncharacterized protein n=2 Tax=Panicum virgatum TaxID=38727 RepID=A0A8T0SR04_PANVG|nr:hypothetical protein PVAP13_5KG426807 [Panicum virgatum]
MRSTTRIYIGVNGGTPHAPPDRHADRRRRARSLLLVLIAPQSEREGGAPGAARRFDRRLSPPHPVPARSTNKTPAMAPISRASVVVLVAAVADVLASAANAEAPAPAPTSDGTSVDQGIAYVLMLVALVLTDLIHPLDASSAYRLF